MFGTVGGRTSCTSSKMTGNSRVPHGLARCESEEARLAEGSARKALKSGARVKGNSPIRSQEWFEICSRHACGLLPLN